jgi:hypothetical protein
MNVNVSWPYFDFKKINEGNSEIVDVRPEAHKWLADVTKYCCGTGIFNRNATWDLCRWSEGCTQISPEKSPKRHSLIVT